MGEVNHRFVIRFKNQSGRIFSKNKRVKENFIHLSIVIFTMSQNKLYRAIHML